ncbi:BspA family leucine-rich repeat surface protein [Collinsella ihumii]|uniref:BspA family leucine-rich repeat surface protein n=1 Tax=Collinsella ihumii TaxID=1720204 RepID=UPI0009ACC322|nr:BspA family leucine-rich repeat surface protein [Collinsella ihumii]
MVMSVANGWIIVCPADSEDDVDAIGDSTLYIEYSEHRIKNDGTENLPKRPSDGTVRGTLASGWFGSSDIHSFGAQPWYPYRNRIGAVRILDVWLPDNGKYLFDGLNNCREFDLLKLDTAQCDSFEGMFRGCSSVTQLFDLDRLNTERVTNTSYMFLNCLSLRAVSIAGWDVSAITETDHMLAGCSTYVLASKGQSSLLDRVAPGTSESGIWRRAIQ